jgi:hypothetical protein
VVKGAIGILREHPTNAALCEQAAYLLGLAAKDGQTKEIMTSGGTLDISNIMAAMAKNKECAETMQNPTVDENLVFVLESLKKEDSKKFTTVRHMPLIFSRAAFKLASLRPNML